MDTSLLLAGMWCFMRGPSGFKINKATGQFIGVYGIYIALSVVSLMTRSVNPSDGWFVWLHLFTLPLFVVVLLLIDSIVKIQRGQVAFVLSCMAGVSIVIGLGQYIAEVSNAGWYLAAADQMRGTYAHKNIFSEVMLLTFPFSWYAGYGAPQKRTLPKIISIATVGIIVLLLSRAVWLGMAIALFVSVVGYYISSGKLRPRWYHGLVVLLLIGGCYLLYQWFVWRTNTGDYLAYFYSQRDTVSERKHLWSATWQIIRSYPIFGGGVGSWKILNMRYAIVGIRNYTTFFQQPHNDYLWIISEQGILAFGAVCSAWGLILHRLLRQIKRNPADLFLYCLLFVFVGYGVYANMAFPRERAEHMLILSFVTFFILSGERDKEIVFSRNAMLPFILMIGLGIWWSGNKLINEIRLKDYFDARAKNDMAEQRRLLNSISPTYFCIDGTATPVSWYSGMLNFAQGNIADAATDFDAAVRANPYHAYSLSNVGTCLNMKGDRAGAEHYFGLALDYSPGFPDAAMNLCAIKFNEGKIDSAALYLGMVHDSTANDRYVKSLNVVTQAIIKPIMDSLSGDEHAVLRAKVTDLSRRSDWQVSIFKKAYIYSRNIRQQILEDMIWSIKNDDQDSIIAKKYQNLVNPKHI